MLNARMVDDVLCGGKEGRSERASVVCCVSRIRNELTSLNAKKQRLSVAAVQPREVPAARATQRKIVIPR